MNHMVQHGGDIYRVSQKIGCLPHEIVDFSSNINPTIPDIDLTLSREEVAVYADRHYAELTAVIASKYQLQKDQVRLFNGASAAIIALFEQLDFEVVTLYAPLYAEYEVAAQRYDKKIVRINRRDEVWEDPSPGSLVIFVNPSTPDGKCYDLDTLLEKWQALGCRVIIDESFLEFTSKPSVRTKLSHYDNLYIIQSFTKFYACAGLRIGAVFSSAHHCGKLFTPTWQISSVDVTLLLRLLANKEHHQKSQKNFQAYAQRLYKILSDSALFDEIYESEANYILVHSLRAQTIEARLLEYKIMVRNCANFDFLDENYLRFAVKDDKALDILETVLDSLHA